MSSNQSSTVVPGGIREMVDVALPMILSLSCETFMTFMDRLFLSRLGGAHMAAALSGGVGSFLIQTIFMGLIGYSTAQVAQHFGAGRQNRCALVLTQAILIGIFSWPILILLRPLGHYLFAQVDINPIQMELQIQYFDILLLGSIFPLIRHAFSSFFSGLGRTRLVMIAAILAMVVNVILNYLLIFGHGGFPALGIVGAAYGTLVGSFVSVCFLVFAYLYLSRKELFFSVRESLRFSRSEMKVLCQKGFPSGLEMLLNMLAFECMILLFHSQGLESAMASTIMFNWDMVSFVPLLGVEVGVTSLVGRYMGAKNFVAMQRSTRSGIKLGWIFSIFILIAFGIFAPELVNVFKPDQNLDVFYRSFDLSVYMVRVAAFYIMIEAIMLVYAGALRGVGDTLFVMLTNTSLNWILLTLLFVILHVLEWGTKIAWLTIVCFIFVFPLVLWLRWKSGKWQVHLEMTE